MYDDNWKLEININHLQYKKCNLENAYKLLLSLWTRIEIYYKWSYAWI